MSESPYTNIEVSDWEQKTNELIAKHPLANKEIIDAVLTSWDSILSTKIGEYGIGVDIFPTQQIMGFLLQQLITLKIIEKYPEKWRGEETSHDKDLVNLSDDLFSIEIKTSSHPTGIFGNRSYAQKSSKGKKKKSGYYLTINNESVQKKTNPRVLRIRFGWIDHADWMGQASATGQQASLSTDVLNFKLQTLFTVE